MDAFEGWIGQLSPDTVAVILSSLGAGAVWLYHQIRGDKTEGFDDVIRGVGKQIVHQLLTDPAITPMIAPEALRSAASKLTWSSLIAIGVPRNAITERLASAVIEHIVGDVLAELRALESLEDQVAQLSAQVSAIPSALAKAEADGIAKGSAWFRDNVTPADLPSARSLPPKDPAK